MDRQLPGLHHVTAIAGDPQRNLDFYAGVLGLRTVKVTVNYDDPETYHFYFGDAEGSPGTLLTFFPWPSGRAGRRGAGQTSATAFSVPPSSFGYWTERLRERNVVVDAAHTRFGEAVLGFRDPDGLALELVAAESDGRRPWAHGPVPVAHAIRGLHGVTLSGEGLERTHRLLVDTLRFRQVGQDGNRYRYVASGGGPAGIVDVVCVPDLPPGRMGTGTVHHIAWRARDAAVQGEFREAVAAAGLNVTPVIDRTYFESIYFREPGGVLFEIATDRPGFQVDEPYERLGTGVALPPWLEARRSYIEARLPAVRLPEMARGA